MAATSPQKIRSSGDTFRLRWEVFDSLAKARGAATIGEQAALVGVDRTTLHRIKRGAQVPSLTFAMNASKALNAPVEALIERAAGRP